MAINHRGFRVTVDMAPDASGTQWHCEAKIEGIEERTRQARIPGVDLTFSRLKIDVLMAMSMVEHKAVTSIDEWHTEHLAADRHSCEIH
ncbi:hypothetical protein [Paraburkholderia rhizosphaerae]|uniref:Uncharacterized protein n=1 Tax=Paraburkholderia rhizosphaerae TaxID=480658 RepID=A0A4R8L897_9BURK|nr:hypothetical protein [Paraburkholderia rhizosphaerae]TDY38931.1 hypothetical protein BX592_12947 [Paraburkholderia rhizosphaerae]